MQPQLAQSGFPPNWQGEIFRSRSDDRQFVVCAKMQASGDWGGSAFYWEKVRDRGVWDFALVSVASAMTLTGTTIQNIRLVVNGVAARPLRLATVEELVKGKPRNEATAAAAGEMAIEGAQALRFNAYKIPLMRNLVKRAIRGVEEWTTS